LVSEAFEVVDEPAAGSAVGVRHKTILTRRCRGPFEWDLKDAGEGRLRAFSMLTTMVDGEPRIIGDPPLIVPIEDLAGGRDIEEFARAINRGYRRTLQGDRKNICWSAFARCTRRARWSGSAASARARGSC
jgi:ribosome modulation factor